MSDFKSRIQKIEKLEREVLQKSSPLIQNGGPIFTADFFVLGAVKRILALSVGFRGLMESRNFTCAASLLRMQIDTAARVFALRQIGDLHDFGTRMISGERFDRQKDINGQKLKDIYIIGELQKYYPWVKKVYEETSDFIHLSGRHFLHQFLKQTMLI